VSVQRWREQRETPKSRVPEALWDEAVAVARVAGLYATAKALHFNYGDLKKRMGRSTSRTVREGKPTFVEVRMPAPAAIVSAAAPAASRVGERIVVELFGHRGEHMRIEGDARALDVAGLVRTIWSRAP
jgi:hypothetical protein